MFETYIILVPVSKGNRGTLEDIENRTFDTLDEVKQLIHKEDKAPLDQIEIWAISDYMCACNDEVRDNKNWWFGYVQIKKHTKHHFITVYSLIKDHKFGELTGHDYYTYITFKDDNGIQSRHDSGCVNVADTTDIRKHLLDMYKPYARAHSLEQIK